MEHTDPSMTSVRSGRIRAFVLRHDPDLLAAKRSAKAAVVVPVVLAVALYGIGNSQTTLFAAFGAFAISVLTDFRGTRRRQATAYGGLVVAGAGLTSLGTVCSTSLTSAVAGMAAIGFVVLFSGVLGSAPANGTFAALLMFVLPVSIPGGLGEIAPRLVGLALAGAIAVPVSLGVWPRPGASLIRSSVHAAANSVAARLDALGTGADGVGAAADSASALSRLQSDLESIPYRPISLAKGDPGVLRIADGLEWLNLNLSLSAESGQPVTGRQVYLDAAHVLRSSAATISDAEGNPAIDTAAATRLTAELATLVASRHEIGLQACASFAAPPNRSRTGRPRWTDQPRRPIGSPCIEAVGVCGESLRRARQDGPHARGESAGLRGRDDRGGRAHGRRQRNTREPGLVRPPDRRRDRRSPP